ncbi:MAG: glutamyl-tRNA reductase [Planctomycetota bacterium]
MRIVLVGLNHRTAPVELREAMAVGKERLPEVLAAFRAAFGGGVECVLLSTCNRTELYVARPAESEPDAQALRGFWAEQTGAELSAVTASSIHREQGPAVHHLFRVTAGLDAMAVGETQVLGQVRRAYEAAQAAGTVGPTLHRVFQEALRSTRRAHAESGVDGLRQSVSSMAVEFAGNLFESFGDKTVAGLGAGEITKVTLRRMLEKKPAKTWVVNRTAGAAAALAEGLGLSGGGGGPTVGNRGLRELPGGARAWEELDEVLVEADVVLTGTASSEPVITAERFRPLVKRRRNRPLFLIDLALPRDVEPAVGALPNVYLYDLDDLNAALAESPGRREKIERCEALVRESANRCVGAGQHQDLGVLVRQLRGKLMAIGEEEKRRTQQKLDRAHRDRDYDRIESLLDEHTHRMINKVLHMPLSQIRKRGGEDGADQAGEASLGFYAAALRRLFELEDGPAGPTLDRDSEGEVKPSGGGGLR